MLLTNLDLSPRALFDYYNQRQTIEAFFKADKHVFGMANLRSPEPSGGPGPVPYLRL